MTDKVISKDKLAAYVEALMGKFAVVAPMERKGSPAEFRELKPGDEPVLSGDKMMMTPKDFLLPRYESLIKVTRRDGETSVSSTIPEDKARVMMGMWLADAQAIQVLDRVFLDKKFTDPYYSARRVNTTLVATIPARPRWSWFCTSVDDVETWKQSVDAIMYDLGESYYFEPITDKGSALIEAAFFTDPSEADKAKKDELWSAFKDIPKQPFAGKALYDNLEWGEAVWAEIAQKCIACGMCSYMCPSCSCFDIQDETHGNCVERYRCRDGCQFEDFTLMGHGHNPRPGQLPRSRQRLLHKFMYQHQQFGVVGCTGCGRCVEFCPVNIDLRDILTKTCSEEEATPDEAT